MLNKKSKKKQLDLLLDQAKMIIESSPVDRGRNHPIFIYVSSIVRKIMYSDIYKLNATYKEIIEIYLHNHDMQWMLYSNSGEREYIDRHALQKPLQINLANNVVWPSPWKIDRFANAISRIGKDVENPFEFKDYNHFSFLMMPIGITFITNGNHSITSGVIKGEGTILVNEIKDISYHCEKYYFDGEYMRRITDNKKIYKIEQFECGVLFEISKLIRKNNINFLLNENVERKIKEKCQPTDKKWRIFRQNGHQFLHYFIGTYEGQCEVDVIENQILFTSTKESYGSSITNNVEELSMYVAQKFNIPYNKLVCFQQYINKNWTEKTMSDQVKFQIIDERLVAPEFNHKPIPEEFIQLRQTYS